MRMRVMISEALSLQHQYACHKFRDCNIRLKLRVCNIRVGVLVLENINLQRPCEICVDCFPIL